MRPIDADALKATMIETLEQIKANPKMNGQEMHIIAGIAMLGEMIDGSPTIDAVPVVRGKWIEHGRDRPPTCSNCGSGCLLNYESDYHKSDYCPHCGADMREEIDHDLTLRCRIVQQVQAGTSAGGGKYLHHRRRQNPGY